MSNTYQDRLISELSRELVQEFSPRELRLFNMISKAYFNAPEKVFEEFRRQEEILGMGLDSVTIVLTPAVLAFASGVITFLWNKVKEAIQEESEDIIAKLVKDMFKRLPYNKGQDEKKEINSTSLTLSREELIELRQMILETAQQLRLPPDETQLLVNAMVGRLATTNK
jgi:hypothetical protein